MYGFTCTPPPLVIPPPLQFPRPLWGERSLGPKSIENARRQRHQRKFLQGADGAEVDLHCDTMVQFCGATPPPPRDPHVTPPGTCLIGGGRGGGGGPGEGGRGSRGEAPPLPEHTQSTVNRKIIGMNNSAHGNAMLSAVNKGNASLNVNSGFPHLTNIKQLQQSGKGGGNTCAGCIPILAAPPSKCSGSAFTTWQYRLRTAVAMSMQHPDTAALQHCLGTITVLPSECSTCIRTYIHPYIHTYIHGYIHRYIHTYIHTCIHTYIHTYIQP